MFSRVEVCGRHFRAALTYGGVVRNSSAREAVVVMAHSFQETGGRMECIQEKTLYTYSFCRKASATLASGVQPGWFCPCIRGVHNAAVLLSCWLLPQVAACRLCRAENA